MSGADEGIRQKLGPMRHGLAHPEFGHPDLLRDFDRCMGLRDWKGAANVLRRAAKRSTEHAKELEAVTEEDLNAAKLRHGFRIEPGGTP